MDVGTLPNHVKSNVFLLCGDYSSNCLLVIDLSASASAVESSTQCFSVVWSVIDYNNPTSHKKFSLVSILKGHQLSNCTI